MKAVKAWGIQERAIATLAGALKGVGKHTEAGMRDLQDFASALQEVSEEGDEATLQVMALGASLSGMAGKDLKALTVAALGLSKVIGSDMKTAMMLLARATKGEFTLFSRYGIKLDETATAQEKFNTVFKASMGGLKIVESQVESLSGRWTQLKNAAGDALEEIGRIITTGSGGSSLAGGIANITDKGAEWTEKLTKVPGMFGSIGGAWDLVVEGFEIGIDQIKLAWDSLLAHLEEPFGEKITSATDKWTAHILQAINNIALTTKDGKTTGLLGFDEDDYIEGLNKMGAIEDEARAKRKADRAAEQESLKQRLEKLKRIAELMKQGIYGVPGMLAPVAGGPGGKDATPFFEWGKGARPRASNRFGGVQAPTVTDVNAKTAAKEIAESVAKALVTTLSTALGGFKVGQKNRQEVLAERSLRTEENMERILTSIDGKVTAGSPLG